MQRDRRERRAALRLIDDRWFVEAIVEELQGGVDLYR